MTMEFWGVLHYCLTNRFGVICSIMTLNTKSSVFPRKRLLKCLSNVTANRIKLADFFVSLPSPKMTDDETDKITLMINKDR